MTDALVSLLENRSLAGFLAAGAVSVLAISVRSLTPSGAIAATLVGGVIVGSGGWWMGLLLVAFFVSSSVLSRVGRRQGTAQARGNQRDAIQVLANGGVPALCCLLALLPGAEITALIAAAAAIAAATADTWATEIGRGSNRAPWLITSLNRVPSGTSGGITIRGTMGSLAGATLIAALTVVGSWLAPDFPSVQVGVAFGIVAVTGVIGSTVDSLLGATVQAQYVCPACGISTEHRIHCESSTVLVRGSPWVQNDVVNALAISTAAVVAALAAFFML